MSYKNYCKSSLTALALAATVAFAPTSSASLSPYSQDFEGMTPNQGFPPNDLEADGWRIFGQVFDADPYTNSGLTPRYVYGPFQAANGDPGSIQGVAPGEGAQGDVALNKYSDYNNTDQVGSYVQASTFQTQLISTSNAGLWRFTYDAKIGNLEEDSSAFAYILIQDFVNPDIFVLNDTTNLPVNWDTYTLDLLIPESYAIAGATLSFGFSATSTDYNGSAVFYDNLNFDRVVVPVPAAVWLFGSGLLGLLGVARRRKH